MMRKHWRRSKRDSSVQEYCLGAIAVGSAQYTSLRSRDDPLLYAAYHVLPGLKSITTRYATIEEAKARVEQVVEVWLRWINEEET